MIRDYLNSLGITQVGIVNTDLSNSYIVMAFPYFDGYDQQANISCYTYGIDYHFVVRSYLEKVAAFMRKQGYLCECYVDIGPPIDKKLAYLAGLGFYGKNSLIINPTYGSYIFIGYVHVKAEFMPDRPLDYGCLECGACQKICHAFSLGFERCASFITQKKGELSLWEQEILKENGLIWGCDRCQRVCPHNKEAKATPILEFKRNKITRITDLHMLSNGEFREKYGDRAFAYKGKKILERNLQILHD